MVFKQEKLKKKTLMARGTPPSLQMPLKISILFLNPSLTSKSQGKSLELTKIWQTLKWWLCHFDIAHGLDKNKGAGLFHIHCKLGDKGLEFNLGRFRFPTGIDQGDI